MMFSYSFSRTLDGSADGGGVRCVSLLGMLSDCGWAKIEPTEGLYDKTRDGLEGNSLSQRMKYLILGTAILLLPACP